MVGVRREEFTSEKGGVREAPLRWHILAWGKEPHREHASWGIGWGKCKAGVERGGKSDQCLGGGLIVSRGGIKRIELGM